MSRSVSTIELRNTRLYYEIKLYYVRFVESKIKIM